MTAGTLEARQGEPDGVADVESGLVAERWGTGTAVRERSFWIALAVATLLHGSLFIGLLGHKPRPVGDESGRDDGISISVVSEADIRSESSVSEPPPGAPGTPAEAVPPPPPPPQPEAKPAEPLPPEPTPPEPQPVEPPKVEAPPELKPSLDVASEISKDVPDLLALPGEGAAPAKKETQKAEKVQEATPPKPPQKAAKPPKKTAALDLAPPPSAFTGAGGAGGRSAGFERPPGITKSGANDAFARAVIRALQGTMPQLRETRGRVTVRIILNENGNVQTVQVVRPSDASSLDQSVVFATKQTSYPFPPPNSNLADRTFLVTYIYR